MRRREPPVVALLTDFGTQDVFVGVIKAVIAQRAPSARVIDLTHEVPPGDVRTGALRLWQALPFLPAHTVILAVVDPGVGTARKAIAAFVSGCTVVCPDNGLLTFVLDCVGRGPTGRAVGQGMQAFQVDAPADQVSSTFHGRDVFAPAVARLAAGAVPQDLGAPAAQLERIALPRLRIALSPLSVSGEMLAVDRFGNLVTSIGILSRREAALNLLPWIPGFPAASLPLAGLGVAVNSAAMVPVVRTYADVPPGALLAYVGSDGLLEIGANGARAADLLGPLKDMEVILRPAG